MKIFLKGKTNIFQEIVDQYKRYISLNLLQNGDKLPSCRNLAQELGINPNTVSKAYTELERQGYITNIPKKGVYVSFNNEEIELKIRDTIQDLHNSKVSKEKLLQIIEEVYQENKDDRN